MGEKERERDPCRGREGKRDGERGREGGRERESREKECMCVHVCVGGEGVVTFPY